MLQDWKADRRNYPAGCRSATGSGEDTKTRSLVAAFRRIGAPVRLKAAVNGEASDSLWYRFRLRPPDAAPFGLFAISVRTTRLNGYLR